MLGRYPPPYSMPSLRVVCKSSKHGCTGPAPPSLVLNLLLEFRDLGLRETGTLEIILVGGTV